jgi:hypothetical protein
MNSLARRRRPAAGLLPAILVVLLAAAAPAQTGVPSAAKAVAAAEAFLATLDDAGRRAVQFAYTDDAQRRKWSNLPTPLFRRAGLRLGDLTPAQRTAALAVLAAVFSPEGYEKVLAIVESDEVLRAQGAPGNLVFGRDEFFLSFVGTPSPTAPWLVQFGGHHLAINATLQGTNATAAPSLPAVQPATFTLNGKTVRPLGNEYDQAFALLHSLDAAQKARAVLGDRTSDLVLGPGQDGRMIAPEGLKGDQLTPAQRTALLDLLGEWVRLVHADAAAARMAEAEAGLADTYFAWRGPTAPGSAAYFRIHGPTVFIEFAPQAMGGSPLNHIHTIYRDPSNDYGRKWGAR